MCVPIGIGMALSLAQGALGYMGQVQSYNAAVSAAQQTTKNAQVAAVNEYAAKQNEIRQEQAAASQKKFEGQLQAKEQTATQAVASGEAGITGSGGYTAGQLLGESYAKAGRFEANVDANYQMTQQRLRSEMKATELQTQNVINQAYSSLPQRPSPLSIFSQLAFG